MENREYARVLLEIGSLMQIKGANPFRVRAFENAARTIQSQTESIEAIMDRGEIRDLPGIGASIATDLEQIRERGTCDLHESLLAELDPGLLEVLQVQGLGPKRVKALYEELGITNLAALEKAARAGEIRQLSGFGAKTEEKIIAEVERLAQSAGRIPLPQAKYIAEGLLAKLLLLPAVLRAEIAGSLRRGRETIGDIDLLVSTEEPLAVHEAFREFSGVAQVLATGDTKTSIRLLNGVQVDLRTVPPELFGSALHYFTGSKEHHIALRTRAKRMGLKINEYGVFKNGSDDPIASATEEEVFNALGLPYIPPELRENQGEFEHAQAGTLPLLVTDQDLLADLHMHTLASDGQNTIEEMAQAAREMGLQYIAITDHSPYIRVTNGMTPERFRAQLARIREINRELDGFRILAGIEVDILKDGSLDMDLALLEEADWVVGSVHSFFGLPKEEMTQRLIKAIESGLLSTLGHPTGRILGGRGGYEYDLDRVIDAAVAHGVAFEINGSAGRLDLNAQLARYVVERGAMITFGSDAHSTTGLSDLQFATQQARRAGLRAQDILNCLPPEELLERVGKKRRAD